MCGVRRAGPADALALVRLRAVMCEAMGEDRLGDEWRDGAQRWFAGVLADPDRFAAFVVDDPELGVVSGAAGTVEFRAPSPSNLSGARGHVFNVATDPRRRRLGHAGACLHALLAWYRGETPVTRIGLHATGDGIGLYRAAGFTAPHYPELVLRY
jgi:ribosomal protein S18 acetylase RimI-like enzyme